jgi:hypothetical protein
MGQWAEESLPELKQRLGISEDDQDAEILAVAREVQAGIELLTGHRMESRPSALRIHHGGLPFVATLSGQSATLRAGADCWPIADPVHPEFANIVQVARAQNLASHVVGKAEALRAAAVVLAAANRQGGLRLAPLLWFAEQARSAPADELLRTLRDPASHLNVSVAQSAVQGWWIQLSLRIRLVSKETPFEPAFLRLLGPHMDGWELAAQEPVLLVARMTQHPSDWAFVARIWATEGPAQPPRVWRSEARAIHAHGLPILCLDERSTPEEVVAQTLLAAYWHGYIDGDEADPIPASLAAAFPRDVDRVRRGTGASATDEAATLLFRRLLRPGFDPTRGAGSIRRYIAHQATTLVREHRSELAGLRPWDEFEIEERHYYKLLARYANKDPRGRYVLDDAVRAKITSDVAGSQQRKNALELLRLHGFGEAAARKHLQRHGLDGIATAQPRRPRVA